MVPLVALPLLALMPASWPGAAGGAQAQVAEVRQEENLRSEPNGTVLGRLQPGTRLWVVAEEGDWLQVGIEGWVWTASLQVTDQTGFDLVVSASEGENIREAPQDRIMGRLERGTLLEELERITGWIRVRREAWIWRPSVAVAQASDEERRGPDPPAAAPFDAPAAEQDRWLRAGAEDLPILSLPDGDTVGRASAGTDVRILSRDGNWGRVQLEGWIWLPALEGGGEDGAVLTDILPVDIPDEPDRFQGRLIELPLQFISLERADRLRSDFYQGEPFLLTRAMEGTRIFVYVAVPPERVAEVEALVPLEEIRVLARVRAPASALTGSPILDLLDLVTPR